MVSIKRKMGVSGVLGSLALALTGCATGWNVDKMNDMDPVGSSFTKALHSEYKMLSNGEASQESWTEADYFAKKAISAGSGTVVQPEQPGDWEVVGDKMAEMTSFRQKLVMLLDKHGREHRPDIAARAQVAYDCLVEQTSTDENHQPGHIKMCRDGFLAAIAALEAPLQRSFVILFNFGSSRLTKEGHKQVHEITKIAGEYPEQFLRIEGHTDTVSSVEYNRKLSLRRAYTVREALKRHGVNGKRMYTSGHSEMRLAEQTKDGVKNQANRRVVVTLQEQK